MRVKGFAASNRGEYEEALGYYEQALAAGGSDTYYARIAIAGLHEYFGRQAYARDDLDEARRRFRSAYQYEPNEKNAVLVDSIEEVIVLRQRAAEYRRDEERLRRLQEAELARQRREETARRERERKEQREAERKRKLVELRQSKAGDLALPAAAPGQSRLTIETPRASLQFAAAWPAQERAAIERLVANLPEGRDTAALVNNTRAATGNKKKVRLPRRSCI